MIKLKFTINKDDIETLKAIHSGIYVIRYKYIDDKEKSIIDSVIRTNFDRLDKNKVPFRLQNKVINLGEQGLYFNQLFKDFNIEVI